MSFILECSSWPGHARFGAAIVVVAETDGAARPFDQVLSDEDAKAHMIALPLALVQPFAAAG